MRRRPVKRFVKALGSTEEQQDELTGARQVGAGRTVGGAVKCVDIYWNADGEAVRLGLS